MSWSATLGYCTYHRMCAQPQREKKAEEFLANDMPHKNASFSCTKWALTASGAERVTVLPTRMAKQSTSRLPAITGSSPDRQRRGAFLWFVVPPLGGFDALVLPPKGGTTNKLFQFSAYKMLHSVSE